MESAYYDQSRSPPAVLANFLTFLPNLASLADDHEATMQAQSNETAPFGEPGLFDCSLATSFLQPSIEAAQRPITKRKDSLVTQVTYHNHDDAHSLCTSPSNRTFQRQEYMHSVTTSPIFEVSESVSSGDAASEGSSPSLEERFTNHHRPALLQHTSTGSIEGEFACWEHGCNGRTFSTRGNLTRHCKERMESRRKHMCGRCGRTFSRSSARDKHLAWKRCLRYEGGS